MKDFLPALERLGTVLPVKSTDEIERLSEQYRAAGEEVVFLSFSPPHQVPLGLSCPTVVVFAWEFDTLPSVVWDDNPQNDWRYALANLQGAICTSQETASLVKQVMTEDFPVTSLPAPVWDRYKSLGSASGLPVELGDRVFPFAGIVIDSPILGLSADGLVRKPSELPPEPEPEPELPPPAGALTQAWQLSKALFKGWLEEIRRPLESPADIALTAEASTPAVTPADLAEPAEAPPLHLIKVSGVVYTTVLNPADSRKNWVELITAFCWAFKEREDATLIVKMTHHDLEYYRIVLITLLSRLAPFSCRVIVLHGFLEDEQYRELIKASTYYVNASSGEGLCLPLMEFLSAGKPGIAPVHSAMSDYVDEQLAFLLKCSLEPFCWPHDPTGVFMTHRHRLNWHSLVKAYQDSYQVAQSQPEHYRSMSQHAFKRMQAFASVDLVAAPLEAFLRALIRNSEARAQREEDMLP